MDGLASPLTRASRSRFRPYALDGAMLYFHPPTGTNVRVANDATRTSRRTAPRVAMFGITNRCNLACDFCSRDTRRDSLWTPTSAAAVLRGLAEAGTLEVAFGGGEPFAFRGFPELLAQLYETTPLALHVTTNGTLLREPTWKRVRGLLGQVRMSIYPDTPWRDAADLLAASGQLWGANVLVDGAALAGLPTLLVELEARRCHDVSLLSYVGPDRDRQLDRDGDDRLARIIAESPLSCRLSVCFGDRVPVPRLFSGFDNGGDCGAGYDFVSITPDQRVQSCSFQDDRLPGATAEEILAAWRTQRGKLAQPSPRPGCARALPMAPAADGLPRVAVWQAFSGNNSGECILVAKFETVGEAERFLAELVPEWRRDEPYSPAWRSLFAEEGVAAATGIGPNEFDRIHRTVFGLSYDADDAFPELRALAWKRGAFVVPGGVHAHDVTLLAAVRAHDRDDARALAEASLHDTARSYPHGDSVLITMPFKRDEGPASLAEAKELLVGYAGGRALSVELFDGEVTDAELVHTKQRLGDELPARPRLFVSFYGDIEGRRDAAARFAASLDDERALAIENGVLIDPIARRKRVAVLAYRHQADVRALEGLRVDVSGTFWFMQPPPQKGTKAAPFRIDPDALLAALRAVLPPSSLTICPEPQLRSVTVTVETEDPGRVLGTFGAQATILGCNLSVWVEDVDPLAWAIRRLMAI